MANRFMRAPCNRAERFRGESPALTQATVIAASVRPGDHKYRLRVERKGGLAERRSPITAALNGHQLMF